MLDYNDLKMGAIFMKDGEPYEVLEYAFVRMQQRKPVAQLKIKNLISGKILNYTAHQNESFPEAEIEKTPIKFLYQHRGEYWFSDINNPKNRFYLKQEQIGESARFLKQNTEVKALKLGDKILNIELPVKTDLKVIEAPPSFKGNTASGTKVVIVETGAQVNAPFFVNQGDIIRVNTQTGEYVERAEKA